MKIKLLLVILLVFKMGYSQTNVSGGIYSNTTWSLAGSPYIMVDTVVVFPGVTLTIQPGVTVKFANDKRLEIRQAKLLALGTATDSITFTSNSAIPIPGIYDGIYLNGGTMLSSFNFCNFKYATDVISTGGGINTTYILNVHNSTITSNMNAFRCPLQLLMDNCVFRNNNYCVQTVITATNCLVVNNNYGILSLNDSNGYSLVQNCVADSNQIGIGSGFLVTNCTMRYNQIGVEFAYTVENCVITNNQIGAYFQGGPGTLTNCIIDGNVTGILSWGSGSRANNINNCYITNNGVGIIDSLCVGSMITRNNIENNAIGIKLKGYQDTLVCNKICNNASYDLKYTGVSNVIVANNYWCTADSVSTAGVVYDGYDNISYGLVNFMPLDTSCYMSLTADVNLLEMTDMEISIYPNPSTGTFTINTNTTSVSQIEIYNGIGERIYKAEVTNTKFEIDLNNHSKGVYFVQMFDENNMIFTKKIIIQ